MKTRECCPTCKRAMPRAKKAKATPLKVLGRALATFAAFAIPAWPGEGIHHHDFRYPMEPAIMSAGTTSEAFTVGEQVSTNQEVA